MTGAGYLWDFARSVLALLGVGALVWLLLRALGQRGFGTVGPVRVVQRIPLEPHRALYVVRAGDKTLLIGCGQGASPALIAELPEQAEPPQSGGP